MLNVDDAECSSFQNQVIELSAKATVHLSKNGLRRQRKHMLLHYLWDLSIHVPAADGKATAPYKRRVEAITHRERAQTGLNFSVRPRISSLHESDSDAPGNPKPSTP